MSTVIRRRRGSRLQLGPYKRHELLTGHIATVVSGYSGYATGSSRNLADYISAAMHADWQANRDELLEFWRSGKSEAEVFPDDCLPWLCLGPRSRAPWAVQHLD
ncbi:hypothetical protein AB7M49_006087 [Bradyrhizobium elkanii]